MLETLHQSPNPKHLRHETLYLKPSKCLRSRKPLRSIVELLSINGEPTTLIPPALQSFIPAFGPQPPSCDLPRKAWVQLTRLRTGVGRFAASMKLLGLCGSDLCECGKGQTAQCTPPLAWLHQIQISVPHWWPCSWNSLLDQSFDQHAILFMYTKEEALIYPQSSLLSVEHWSSHAKLFLSLNNELSLRFSVY